MQHRILPALLVIQHDLQGEPRLTRPVRLGRDAPIADHVARVDHGISPRGFTAKSASMPVKLFARGRARSPVLLVPRPSVTSPSTSLTAAPTPSTTGAPISAAIEAPSSAIPAQPRMIAPDPSSAIARAQRS